MVELAFRKKEEEGAHAVVPRLVLRIEYPTANVFDRVRDNLFNCNPEGCFVGPAGVTRGGLALRIGENVQAVVAGLNNESGRGYVAGLRFDEHAMDKLANIFSDLIDSIAPKQKG